MPWIRMWCVCKVAEEKGGGGGDFFLLSIIIAGTVNSRMGRFQGSEAVLRNPIYFTSFK